MITRKQTSLIVILACLFLAASRRMDVGYFNDDARYITAADAISQGHYNNLELPGHPSTIDRLPGFPLLLAPFVHLVNSHWALLKLISILFTMLACLLLYIAFADFMSPMQRSLLVLLFGINPTVIKYSASVMSEPCFLFFVMGTFAAFRLWLKKQENLLLYGVFTSVLAMTILIRPEGLALLVAILVVLLLERLWLAAWGVFSVTCLTLGSWLLRNALLNKSPSGYAIQGMDILARVSGHYGLFLENAGRTMKVLIVDSLLQASFPAKYPLQILIASFLCVLVSWIVMKGFVIQRQGLGKRRMVCLSMGFFVLFSVTIHALFLSVNTRYFFSLIPFLLAWLISGMKRMRVWGVLALLFLYANPWSSPSDKLWGQHHAYRISRQTMTWIRESTPRDAYLLAIKASTVHLYTNRFSSSEIAFRDLEDFRYRLLEEHVTHILVEPHRLMILSGKNFLNMMNLWDTAPRWTMEWPEAFKKVYENAAEETTVYQVIPDERYQKAYRLCLSADEDFSGRRWDQGISKLREALRLYPHFPGALNRYGLAVLRAYGDRVAARRKFLEAIALRPDFAFGLINMARLAQDAGDMHRAQAYRMRAQESFKIVPSWSGDPQKIQEMLGTLE